MYDHLPLSFHSREQTQSLKSLEEERRRKPVKSFQTPIFNKKSLGGEKNDLLSPDDRENEGESSGQPQEGVGDLSEESFVNRQRASEGLKSETGLVQNIPIYF